MTGRRFLHMDNQEPRHISRGSEYVQREVTDTATPRENQDVKANTQDLPTITQAQLLGTSIDGIVSNPPVAISEPEQPAQLTQDTVGNQQQVLPSQEASIELEQAPKKHKKIVTRNNIVLVMAAIIFLLGIGIAVNSYLLNKRVTEQVLGTQATDVGSDLGDDAVSDGEQPDESPVSTSAVSAYKVAPDLPESISVEKFGISGRVKPMGVSATNQMLAPKSIYDAGWYEASAKPGIDAGAVVINGHVHGPTRPGIFHKISKLQAGDNIGVKRGDGVTVTYRVESTKRVKADQVNMAELLTSVKPGKQGLNLITCGGKVNLATQQYEDRDIVFAVIVD